MRGKILSGPWSTPKSFSLSIDLQCLAESGLTGPGILALWAVEGCLRDNSIRACDWSWTLAKLLCLEALA